MAYAPLDRYNGQLVVQTVVVNEYAYNTDVSDANTTASGFANGEFGARFGAFTASRTKRVTWDTDNFPGDKHFYEVYQVNRGWIQLISAAMVTRPLTGESSQSYGVGFAAVTSMANAMDVQFGAYRQNTGGSYGAAGTLWNTISGTDDIRWRVRRERVVQMAYNSGLSNLVTPGLVYQSDWINIAAQISCAQAGYAVVRAIAQISKDKNGLSTIEYILCATFNSASVSTIIQTIAGCSFKTGTTAQAASGRWGGNSLCPSIYAAANSGSIYAESASVTATGIYVSGKAELNAIPAWA